MRIDDVRVVEGDAGTRSALVTLHLGTATGKIATVDVRTLARSATSDVDYASVATRVVFGKQQTTATVAVPIVGDSSDEPDETFSVLLSNPAGAAIDDPEGVVTIVDDDEAPPAPPAPSDLSLVLTDDEQADQLLTGDVVRYTLAVRNLGPGAATGVSAIDRLPDGLTFVAADQGCAIASDGETVTCTRPDSLAAGASWSPWIDARVTRTDVIIDTAQTSSAVPDPSPANNVDSEATSPVAPNAHVAVTQAAIVGGLDGASMSSWGGRVVVARPSTYSVLVHVTNDGPTRADDVEVELFDEADARSILAGACPAAPPQVPGLDAAATSSAACAVGSLAAGEGRDVYFTLAFDPGGSVETNAVPYRYLTRRLDVDVRSTTPGRTAELYDGEIDYIEAERAGVAWLEPSFTAPATATLGSTIRVTGVVRNLGPWHVQDVSFQWAGQGVTVVGTTNLEDHGFYGTYVRTIPAGGESFPITIDLRMDELGEHTFSLVLPGQENFNVQAGQTITIDVTN